MADPEINRSPETPGTRKSLVSILKPPTIKIKRKHLARYSWLPDVLRYDGSVIRNIAGPVFTVTIFASIVAYLDTQGQRINLTNNVVPLLSVVVGLILVFRNSTSYDRWNEGRKDFGSLTSDIRNMARNIWTCVNPPPEQNAAVDKYTSSLPVYLQQPHPQRTDSGASSSTAKHAATAQNLSVAYHLRNEKIRAIKLLIAFAVATKHHLRNEPGLDYEDYSGLIPPALYQEEASGWERIITTSPDHVFTPTEAPSNRSRRHSRSHFSTHRKPTSTTPLLTDSQRTVEFHAYPERKHMPVPLIIAHEISRALFRFKRFGCMDVIGPAMHNGIQTMLSAMVDQLTLYAAQLHDSWMNTYASTDSIHLKQCVTLYLFTLPFTLVTDLGFTMIPVVTVVAFTLMGIEGIADEIEHPFGIHANDHPLDKYCAELREELMFMVERLPEGIEEEP